MAADTKLFELQKSNRPFWKAEISLITPCFIVQGHLIMPGGLKMALKFGILADFLLHSLHTIAVSNKTKSPSLRGIWTNPYMEPSVLTK